MRVQGRLVCLLVVGLLIGGPRRARADEVTRFEAGAPTTTPSKTRQLQPYLDRWATPEQDSVFRDPNLRSKYQGDLPFYQDWLFLNLELTVDAFFKRRENPDFRRGEKTQTFNQNNEFRRLITLAGFELRNADDVFKPATWRLRFIGAGATDRDFNVVDNKGHGFAAVQEAFAEHEIFSLGELDLSFLRAGIEPFKSEFHGLIFFDNAVGARVFGEYSHNKYRYTLGAFRLFQKDPPTQLNDLGVPPKDEYVSVASLQVRDVTPGWNGEFVGHWDHNRQAQANAKAFDRDTFYGGSTFNGRLGVINFNPAAYFVGGRDNAANKKILAGVALLDAAYTLPMADFVTLRSGYLFQSGDRNPNDRTETGFASINDNVALFGAGASYWTGEAINFNLAKGDKNAKTQLVKTNSAFVLPGNFNSPGVHLFNAGVLTKITQRLDHALNLNYMMFAEPDGMAQLIGRPHVDRSIGLDVNTLFEWRPFQQNTFVIDVAGSVLFPDTGFQDVVGSRKAVYALTTDMRFIY